MGVLGRIALLGAAGASGMVGGILLRRSHVMPRDEYGEFDTKLTGTIGAIAAGAGAVLSGVAALGMRGSSLSAARLGVGALAAHVIGAGAATWLVNNDSVLGPLFGASYNGPVDRNLPDPQWRRAHPAHPANHEYQARTGDLLPDGVPLEVDTAFVKPGTVGDRQLHYSTTVANLGDGPIELVRGEDPLDTPGATNYDVEQIVRNEDGKDNRFALNGSFSYHPEHRHVHFDDWTKMELLERNPDGSAGEAVGETAKLSFAIADVNHVSTNIDPDGKLVRRRGIGDLPIQGLSPGWADTYGPLTKGQSINIEGVENGTYILRTTFDPENKIAESSEDNNVRDTVIRIDDGIVGLDDVDVLSSAPPKLGRGEAAKPDSRDDHDHEPEHPEGER